MTHLVGRAIDDLVTPDPTPRSPRIWTDSLNEKDTRDLKTLCKTSYERENWWAKSHLGDSLADRSIGEYAANGFMMLYSTSENRTAVTKNDPALVNYTQMLEKS